VSLEDDLRTLEADLVRRNLAPGTRKLLVSVARRFLAYVEKPADKVTRDDVRAYLAKKSTSVGDLGKLRSVFRTLAEDKTDPTAGLTVKIPEPTPRLVISPESVGALLAAALRPRRYHALDLRDRACLELLYGLGLRASEVRDIRVLDLRLPEASLLVRRAKRGQPRVLPIPQLCVEHLERYQKARASLRSRTGGTGASSC